MESPALSQELVDQLKSQGKLVLVVDGNIYAIPETFTHPGGQEVSKLRLGSLYECSMVIVEFNPLPCSCCVHKTA